MVAQDRLVLDQVRFDVARQLPRETTLTVTQIGVALGFSENTVFTYAFRRWSEGPQRVAQSPARRLTAVHSWHANSSRCGSIGTHRSTS